MGSSVLNISNVEWNWDKLNFKYKLLGFCQNQFQSIISEPSLKLITLENIEYFKQKKCKSGFTALLSHMYKNGVIDSFIIHQCVGTLFKHIDDHMNVFVALNMLSQCYVEMLKDDTHKHIVKQYILFLELHSKNKMLPSRMRFLIKDFLNKFCWQCETHIMLEIMLLGWCNFDGVS